MIYDPVLTPFIDEQRAFNDKAGLGPPPPAPPPPDQLAARDEQLLGAQPVQVRIMRPDGALRGVCLHIHGGGFKYGSAAMADRANSGLARSLAIAVLSVEYRLAPAHPHPAALQDCLAAARWLIAQARTRFGTERLLLAGDSVGATLAVQLLLQLRAAGEASRFCGANLVAGNFDLSMTPSQRASSDALFLSPARLAETRESEFPGLTGEALRSSEYSPLYAQLQALPPAIFTVGTRDAVLDDSLFMAMRWRAAGNHADLQVYPEGTHTFLGGPTRMAAEARRRMQQFLQQCLDGTVAS